MNSIVKQICDIRTQLSFINFQEHLSHEDYKTIEKLENDILELQKQLPKNLVAIKFSDGWYLTDDADLCFCDEPTWFDDEVEALLYLDRAKIKEIKDYEFVYFK